jgi:AraC-like DNA-binding protein
MPPFDFDFRLRSPQGALGRAVASIWYARGRIPYRRERIGPTGSSVAVIVLDDPIIETALGPRGGSLVADRGFLIGPHDRPVINEPTGETFAVGVVTTPVGCEAAFGVRPASVAGRVVPIDEAWPSAAAVRADLLAMTDPDAMLDRLERALDAGLDLSDPGLDRCARAVERLEADPLLLIAQVAREAGLSHGHLDREFRRIVGLSPRRLARQRRVARLLAGIDARSDVAWADLAAKLGWADQSRLIRDVKRHTGVTPSAYLVAQRAWMLGGGPADAAGFVPEAM